VRPASYEKNIDIFRAAALNAEKFFYLVRAVFFLASREALFYEGLSCPRAEFGGKGFLTKGIEGFQQIFNLLRREKR